MKDSETGRAERQKLQVLDQELSDKETIRHLELGDRDIYIKERIIEKILMQRGEKEKRLLDTMRHRDTYSIGRKKREKDTLMEKK